MCQDLHDLHSFSLPSRGAGFKTEIEQNTIGFVRGNTSVAAEVLASSADEVCILQAPHSLFCPWHCIKS